MTDLKFSCWTLDCTCGLNSTPFSPLLTLVSSSSLDTTPFGTIIYDSCYPSHHVGMLQFKKVSVLVVPMCPLALAYSLWDMERNICFCQQKNPLLCWFFFIAISIIIILSVVLIIMSLTIPSICFYCVDVWFSVWNSIHYRYQL